MKDDPSTPTPEGLSPNEFERDKPGTTGRSRAEAAIEDLRQRGGIFVEAVRATRMPMALTDPNLPGNPIVFANEAFVKLSGYRMDEVLGQQPHFMNGPGTDPHDAARFEEAIRSDQDDVVETVQYRKNGSRFVATVLISAFKDDDGHTLNHFLSYLDVTRRAEAEQEISDLRGAQAALESSQKLLRESEKRQSFLLALEDRLRPLADASEIMNAATHFLGTHLNVDRSMYAEVEGDRGAEVGTVRGQYVRTVAADEEAVTAFPLHFTYETYGDTIMEARYSGNGLVVSDIAAEPRVSKAERSAWLDARVAAAVVAPLVKDGRLVAELGIQSRTPRSWTDAEVSLVRDVAERTWAAAERAHAETALRASEEKYRTLFESMDQAYAVIEVLKDEAGQWVDFRFLNVNPAFLEHTSMPYPVGKTATELLGTPNPRWTELYGQALDTGKPIRIEEDEPTLGRTFDLNIFSLDRDLNRVAVLFTNISGRKAAEEALKDSEGHARVLLAELQHRVRNTLAVVRSIARRTAERTDGSADFMSHFEGRLNAFSRAQAGVTRSASGSVELKSLVEDELLALATRQGEHLRIEGPTVGLTSRAAESMSLAIHELATNAVKYGALTVPDGQIRVTWRLTQDEDSGALAFDWREWGLETAPTRIREGFGHELLLRSLPYDLGAKTAITFEEKGLHFTMALPLQPNVIAEETSLPAE
jgi:PAS domain S-box-containing protein